MAALRWARVAPPEHNVREPSEARTLTLILSPTLTLTLTLALTLTRTLPRTENRQKLKDGFGDSWTGASVRDSGGSPTERTEGGPAAEGAAANPMVGEKRTNPTLPLTLALP